MCGICGVVATNRRGAVKAMIHTMSHRGPDARGMLNDGRVRLGLNRLVQVDKPESENQRMETQDRRIAIVFTGELSNFREERRFLKGKGYKFYSVPILKWYCVSMSITET